MAALYYTDPDPAFHFIADPYPAFHLHADPDPAPQHPVIQICNHWSTDHPGLHFERPSLHCERPQLHFEPLQLVNFDLNADPDSTFLSTNVKPDPYQLPKLMRTQIRNPDRRYIPELKDRQEQSGNSPFGHTLQNKLVKLVF